MGSSFMLAVRRPDGELPEIGDSDGGRLFPLVERGHAIRAAHSPCAAAMFGRGDFATLRWIMTADVPWLMGVKQARTAFAAAVPATPAGVASDVSIGRLCRDANRLGP